MKCILTAMWLGLSLVGAAQPTHDFTAILQASLSHPCLRDMVPLDSTGHPLYVAVLANNQMPRQPDLHVAGRPLPVATGRYGEAPPGHILLRRLRLLGNRASLRLAYGPAVRARMRLRYTPELGWHVRHALTWRRVTNARGRQGTQFCWDF